MLGHIRTTTNKQKAYRRCRARRSGCGRGPARAAHTRCCCGWHTTPCWCRSRQRYSWGTPPYTAARTSPQTCQSRLCCPPSSGSSRTQLAMTTHAHLQHLAAPYITLQHLTTPYGTLHDFTTYYRTLQHITTPYRTLQHLTGLYNTL